MTKQTEDIVYGVIFYVLIMPVLHIIGFGVGLGIGYLLWQVWELVR